MEALQIIAGSWPIAAMTIGLGGIFAGWTTIRRSMKFARAAEIDRSKGNQAIVVRSSRHDGEEG